MLSESALRLSWTRLAINHHKCSRAQHRQQFCKSRSYCLFVISLIIPQSQPVKQNRRFLRRIFIRTYSSLASHCRRRSCRPPERKNQPIHLRGSGLFLLMSLTPTAGDLPPAPFCQKETPWVNLVHSTGNPVQIGGLKHAANPHQSGRFPPVFLKLWRRVGMPKACRNRVFRHGTAFPGHKKGSLHAAGCPFRFIQRRGVAGSSRRKVLPLPRVLSAVMDPPLSSTIRCTSARPSPLPTETREESP